MAKQCAKTMIKESLHAPIKHLLFPLGSFRRGLRFSVCIAPKDWFNPSFAHLEMCLHAGLAGIIRPSFGRLARKTSNRSTN
jgi:hypothetical protein